MKMNVFALIISASIASCTSGRHQTSLNDSNNVDTALADTSGTVTPKKTYTNNPSNWSYDTTSDAMTSGSIIIAKTEATNHFEFAAPYDGDNGATIKVRKKRGTTETMLKIEKGQFIGGVQGTNIKVRFDQHPYSEYYCTGTSDYDPTILFINEPGDFVSRLRKAKKVLIEANIYNNGNQLFEFTVDGFQWGSKPKHREPGLNKYGGHDYVMAKTKSGKDTLVYKK